MTGKRRQDPRRLLVPFAVCAIAAACSDDGSSPSAGGIVGSGGMDCSAYRALTEDHEKFVDYLGGPKYAAFHDDDGSDHPTQYDRDNAGTYCYGDCLKQATDWAGHGGQVLYSTGGPGVSRARFGWSKNEDHGGEQYAHLYLLKPVNQPDEADGDSWFTSKVDPSVDVEDWKATNGGKQLSEPLAIGRGRVTWSNHGILAFRNGLVGAVGSGNSADQFPFVMLDEGKVPTDVAVTNNNEFALITVWDTTACRGQVAVLALQERDEKLFALPNEGFIGAIKLLGYVELPIAVPTRINASNDFGLYMQFSSKEAQAELATQAGRDKWSASQDVQHTAAGAGFALVASRDENKVVVLDLEPLFQFYRSMYTTSQAKYDETTNVGPEPDQWPYAFSKAPESRPVVTEVIEVEQPASVVTGHPVGDRSFTDKDFAKKAYIATVDGTLTAYDVGGLGVEGPATKLEPITSLQICRNPTRVAYGMGGSSRDGLVFVCRGDRAVQLVDGGGASLELLEDSRLEDPVTVIAHDARGAQLLTVGDFEGRQVVNYLNGPINAWGDLIFGGLGPDGTAEFEFTGSLAIDGKVFLVSSAAIP